jgi:hypothetical protein
LTKPGKKLLVKVTFWLVAEIALSFVGLDDFANYSEYIFERHHLVAIGKINTKNI